MLAASPAVIVTVSPAVQLPGRPTRVSVRGLPGPVSIEIERATTPTGRLQPRVRIHRGRGLVPAPELVGTYRVLVHRGADVFRSNTWLLRVVPQRARARHVFATPEAAARDWVAHLRGSPVLVASKRWQKTALDRRDRDLNAYLVIAYAFRGDRNPRDRWGCFVAVARDRVGGPWRFLQATVAPYGG